MLRGLFQSTLGADSMLMYSSFSVQCVFFWQMPAAAAIRCFNFCVRGCRRIEILASKKIFQNEWQEELD
jgi:hypothetical protein